MSNNFNEWLDELENDQSIQIDTTRREHIKNRVMSQIHNAESMENSNASISEQSTRYDNHKSNNMYQKHSFFKFANHTMIKKVAIVCIAIASIFGISIVGYASIESIMGVFKLKPEIEKQIDHENPTIAALDEPDTLKSYTNKYENTDIVDEHSFSDPELYGPVTDIELQNSDGKYTISNIAFDTDNIAILTQEDGLPWQLQEDDVVTLTISIDTNFAASEPSGEDIVFAYIYDSKYYDIEIQKVTDQPTTYKFTVPQDGNYYFGIENMSATYIKITNLEIE